VRRSRRRRVFGVLENPSCSNDCRGWMLHFNSTLTTTLTPGAFGWDHTPSIVPAAAVASYTGNSPLSVMTKYNGLRGRRRTRFTTESQCSIRMIRRSTRSAGVHIMEMRS